MIRYMPASITPWVLGALLILVSALLKPVLDFSVKELYIWVFPESQVEHVPAEDFSVKELVLWVFTLLVASCIASCYSPRHKLLAGLSYMVLFPLIVVVIECLHEIQAVIVSDGWIDGVKSIIRFFFAYWAIGCIPVLVGSLLGSGFSKFKVGAFGNPYIFGYFLISSTTLITYQVGIIFDIPMSLLISGAGIDLTPAMGWMFFCMFPSVVALASLFAASYAALYHPWKYRPLVWLWYMVIFPIPAVFMAAAAYILSYAVLLLAASIFS